MKPFCIGHDETTGRSILLRPVRDEFFAHGLCTGETGLGKSKSMISKARYCINNRIPVVVADPNGDAYWDCVRYITMLHRERDAVLIDANQAADRYAFCLNFLVRNGLDSATHASGMVRGIAKVFEEQDSGTRPRLERRERATLVALIEAGCTLADMLSFLSLSDDRFRHEVLQRVSNPYVRAEWQEFDAISKRADKENLIESTLNRAAKIILNDPVRRVVGSELCNLDWQEIRAKRKVVLINLQPVKVSRECQKLLGIMILDHLANYATQLTRRESDMIVLADEADEITSPDFALCLQEFRKRGVFLWLYFQFLEQLRAKDDTRKLYAAAMSCCRTKLVFAGSYEDSALIARELFPGEFRGDLVKDTIHRTLLLPKESRREIVGRSEGESDSTTETDAEATIRSDGYSDMSFDGYSVGEGQSVGGLNGELFQFSDHSGRSSASGSGSSSMSGHSTSHSTGRSVGHSRSQSSTIVPFYEFERAKELASRNYYSVEEELEKRIARIQLQPMRHALLKFGNRPVMAIVTAFVKPARAWPKDVERTLDCNAKRYALPVAEADRVIEQRKQKLLTSHLVSIEREEEEISEQRWQQAPLVKKNSRDT